MIRDTKHTIAVLNRVIKLLQLQIKYTEEVPMFYSITYVLLKKWLCVLQKSVSNRKFA